MKNERAKEESRKIVYQEKRRNSYRLGSWEAASLTTEGCPEGKTSGSERIKKHKEHKEEEMVIFKIFFVLFVFFVVEMVFLR